MNKILSLLYCILMSYSSFEGQVFFNGEGARYDADYSLQKNITVVTWEKISGVTEMLMQSQNGSIDLLPALPSAWPTGSIKGICARGGFDVNIIWKDKKLKSTLIYSKSGKQCRIRPGIPVKIMCDNKQVKTTIQDGALFFLTTAGKAYQINTELK